MSEAGLSPIGTSCHFPSAGTPPFRRAYARHLPRFIGGVYPEGGSEVCSTVIASMPSEQTCLQGFANDGIHKTIGVF